MIIILFLIEVLSRKIILCYCQLYTFKLTFTTLNMQCHLTFEVWLAVFLWYMPLPWCRFILLIMDILLWDKNQKTIFLLDQCTRQHEQLQLLPNALPCQIRHQLQHVQAQLFTILIQIHSIHCQTQCYCHYHLNCIVPTPQQSDIWSAFQVTMKW